LLLAVVGVCTSVFVTAAFAGSALGYVMFLGSGLSAGVATAWIIARRRPRPRWLVAGAILTATASLAAPLLLIVLIFAIAGAGH